MSTNVEQGVAHDEKFHFLSKDTVWWSEKRGCVFFIETFFWTRKIDKSLFLPHDRENMRKKNVFNTF